MSQPISLPPPPCEDDAEREMLFNHQRNMLDDSIAADNVERKSTPFLILLTIGMGGYVQTLSLPIENYSNIFPAFKLSSQSYTLMAW